MAQHVMPFLVVNYGCEMMFVLNTRLEAQLIEPTKSQRIKSDLVSNMFSPVFMDELFRPQEMYSSGALRNVFTTISDTSIMRLSESSMKKLFDLMSMTVKYQVLSLHHPYELLEYTVNHLVGLRALLPEHVHAIVDGVVLRIQHLAAQLGMGRLAEVRRAILNSLLDRRIKVSLFLEQGIQFLDGNYKLTRAAHLPPVTGAHPPGRIIFYSGGACTAESFEHRDAQLTVWTGVPQGHWGPLHFTMANPRLTTNGENLYRAGGANGGKDALAAHARELPRPHATPATVTDDSQRQQMATQVQAYKNEMNYLSSLVGSHGPQHQEKIVLSLFEDEDTAGSARGGAPLTRPQQQLQQPTTAPVSSAIVGGSVATVASASAPHPAATHGGSAGQVLEEEPDASAMIKVCRMDAGTIKQQNQQLLGIISGLDVPCAQAGGAVTAAGGGQGDVGAEGDLLDIMDDI